MGTDCPLWCELSTQASGGSPTPSQFFLTEVLRVPPNPELGLIPAITNYHKFCDLKHTFNILQG